MYDYTVHFQRSNGSVGTAKFTEPDEKSARRAFRECYRHDNYKIIDIDVSVSGRTVAEQLDNIASHDNITPAQREAIAYASQVIRFLENNPGA